MREKPELPSFPTKLDYMKLRLWNIDYQRMQNGTKLNECRRVAYDLTRASRDLSAEILNTELLESSVRQEARKRLIIAVNAYDEQFSIRLKERTWWDKLTGRNE